MAPPASGQEDGLATGSPPTVAGGVESGFELASFLIAQGHLHHRALRPGIMAGRRADATGQNYPRFV
jgi:hypothetical protein